MPSESAKMIIAQITDTHVRPKGVLAYNRVSTNSMLEDAVEHLNALASPPAVVIVTGDLVDGGKPEEYAHFRDIVGAISAPVYLIPGNHDDRAAMVKALPDHKYLPREGGFLHYVVEDFPVRLIGLDTVLPGSAGGLMCERRLAWFSDRLAEAPERPTLVFMHHPPFLTGVRHMDDMGLSGSDSFAKIVARNPQIERVVCGHLHRPIQIRLAGTLVSTAPSTAHQVVLDLREDGPAEYNMEPPACHLHVWDGGQGIVSHTSYIGKYDGPYPFG
jgi:3',5'-cyclic-AMP phosphodiesterase